MLETQLYGKLLPTQPDIMPILVDIRNKYQIPEITSEDNGLEVLLKYHLEIDWGTVRSEILQRLKDLPELIPPQTRKAYLAFKNFERTGLVDPELKKVSSEFRQNVNILINTFFNMYRPTIKKLDEFYVEVADHCIEFLLTGEAREIPQGWLAFVETIPDNNGGRTVIAMANQLADPEKIAEEFKAEFYSQFGHDRPKITEDDVRTADLLRMRWFGKPIEYLLEEEERTDPSTYRGKKSRRYPTALRKHHSRMRQKLHRLQADIFKILK